MTLQVWALQLLFTLIVMFTSPWCGARGLRAASTLDAVGMMTGDAYTSMVAMIESGKG